LHDFEPAKIRIDLKIGEFEDLKMILTALWGLNDELV